MAAISVLSNTQRVALASVLSLDMNVSRCKTLIERARGRGRCSIVVVEASSATEGLAKAMLDCRITTGISSTSDVRADAKLDSGVGGKGEPGIGERAGVLSFKAVFGEAEDVAVVSCHLITLDTFQLSPRLSSSLSSNIPGWRRRATISLELVERDRRLSLELVERVSLELVVRDRRLSLELVERDTRLSLEASSGWAEARRRFRMNALTSLHSVGAKDNEDIDALESVERDTRLSLGASSGWAEVRRRFRMNALTSLLSVGAKDNEDIDPNTSVRWLSVLS